MPAALPLNARQIAAGDWPAAQAGGLLLEWLGAQVCRQPTGSPSNVALSDNSGSVIHSPSTHEEDWRCTGLAALTGRASGPPLQGPGHPGTLARAVQFAVNLLAGVDAVSPHWLGERARLLGLTRNGDSSAGSAARIIAASDGWFALNLPRDCDTDLVPALVETQVRCQAWEAIAAWAQTQSVDAAMERAMMLGLAVGRVARPGPVPALETPWAIQMQACTPLGRRPPLRVVNLGALWAAPLCAQVLRRCAMRVLDVHSVARVDEGPPDVYRALHEGHERLVLDFAAPEGRQALREALQEADIVIEASRARALEQLGVAAPRIMMDRRPRTWIRITGHGHDSNRIAFGDDAAVEGGLTAWDNTGPMFVGDALADPLTGLLAAVAALACSQSADHAWIVDVAMVRSARLAAAL